MRQTSNQTHLNGNYVANAEGIIRMNDFTKEELETCRDGISWMISECSFGDNDDEVESWEIVMYKIRSMIDNYSENPWNELQWFTIRKIQSMLNDCHHIDIVIRHNGEDIWFQADFLKQLMRKT